MSQLRPYPLSGNENAFLAAVGDAANSRRVIPGNGIRVNQTAHGVQVSAVAGRDINYTRNRGYYDFNTEYWPNDIIYVSPLATYKDQNGHTLNVPAGGYICITYVPPSTNSSTFFLGSIIPSIENAGGTPTDTEANNYRWYGNNNYYPVTPTSTGSTATTVAVSGYNIVTSQSFWQPIGGAGAEISWQNWDENAAIPKSTLIWVDPNTSYSRSFFDIGDNKPPLSAGLFITLDDIPAKVSGSRLPGNYDWPFYPPLPADAEQTVSGSTYNKNYFGQITPLSPQDFCASNGERQSGFGLFIASGSVYSYALPYTG